MDATWWNELTDSIVLGNCKSSETGKVGQLLATPQAIIFKGKGLNVEIPWGEVKSIRIDRLAHRRGQSALVAIQHKSMTSVESEDITTTESHALDVIDRVMIALGEERAKSDVGSTSFERASYLGGLPEVSGEIPGVLRLNRVGLDMDGTEILRWSDCRGVAVESQQVAKSKLAAALAFGLLGAVTAKGTQTQSILSARRTDGAVAYFQLDDWSWQVVKARIAPLLVELGVPMMSDVEGGAVASGDLLSDLERLVALRESDHLTEDEFNELKRRLIG